MGWKMLVSHIWRSKEDIGEKSDFYDFLHPQNFFYTDVLVTRGPSCKRSAKLGCVHGSPAFRRKGLLKRQG